MDSIHSPPRFAVAHPYKSRLKSFSHMSANCYAERARRELRHPSPASAFVTVFYQTMLFFLSMRYDFLSNFQDFYVILFGHH